MYLLLMFHLKFLDDYSVNIRSDNAQPGDVC